MRSTVALVSGIAIGAAVSLSIAMGPLTNDGKQVIAITKAEWSSIMSKNASSAMKNVDEDCTMWVPDFPNRLDGKNLIYNLTEAETQGTGELIFAEMSNEHVQVYGDVAILSYNYMGLAKDKEGKVEPTTAKSSRVYVKRDNDWWLVHANFAPVSE